MQINLTIWEVLAEKSESTLEKTKDFFQNLNEVIKKKESWECWTIFTHRWTGEAIWGNSVIQLRCWDSMDETCEQ